MPLAEEVIAVDLDRNKEWLRDGRFTWSAGSEEPASIVR